MRKKILAFVFAAALVVAMAVPLVGDGGVAYAQEQDGNHQGEQEGENGEGEQGDEE